MSNGVETSYKELFDGMNKLAKHGFEFFIAGIGALLLFGGIVMTPKEFLSLEELRIISIFGFISLMASIYVWRQKTNLKFRTNQEILAIKRLNSELITKRYEIAERSAIEQQQIAEKAAGNRRAQADEAAIERLKIATKIATAMERDMDVLEKLK